MHLFLFLNPSNSFYIFVLQWTKVHCLFFNTVPPSQVLDSFLFLTVLENMDASICPICLRLLWQTDLYIQMCR